MIMRARNAWWLPAVVLMLLVPSDAPAAKLSMKHRGLEAPKVLNYDETGASVGSSARLFDVREGDVLCWEINDANPLLYSYVTTVETLKVESIADIGEFLEKLKGILPLKQELSKTGREDLIGAYKAAVEKAIDQLQAIERFKWASDEGSFLESVQQWRGANTIAETQLNEAKKTREKLDGTSSRDIALIQFAETAAITRHKAMKEEWSKAVNELEQGGASTLRCVELGRENVAVSLKIAKKGTWPGERKPARFVGDVGKIKVNPASGDHVVLAAGSLMGFFDSERSYSIKNDVVVETEEERTPLRPAAFLFLRPSIDWKVWTILGAGSGVEKIERPDLFLGLGFRVAGSPNDPLMTFGAGVQRSWFRSRLPDNVRVGEPLPAEITDLAEVLEYDGRWGPAIILTFYGIEL